METLFGTCFSICETPSLIVHSTKPDIHKCGEKNTKKFQGWSVSLKTLQLAVTTFPFFMFNFWRKYFFANAHAFFVKPLITNRTSSHKVINTIFRLAHKKVLSAYPKNIRVSLKKSATWNPPWNLWKRW